MHVVKSIEIHGFRGQSKPIKLRLDRHANFLIGRNGTGKTTLINLVNAALSLDHRNLRRHAWSRLIIKFRMDGSNVVPSLELNRSSPSRASVVSFTYKPSSKAEPHVFNFAARGRNLVRTASGRVVPQATRQREIEKTLAEQISGLFKITWLSLARADQIVSEDPWEDSDENLSDVDRKLKHSFTNLISYFSRLDGRVSDETRDFQKHWFLSFLSPAKGSYSTTLKQIDLESEEDSMRSIFQQFEMDPESFETLLTQYLTRVGNVKSRKNEHVFDSLEQVGVIYDAMRLHSLVERWQTLQSAQMSTYKPKLDFIELASELLFEKDVLVNRSNQTVIINPAGMEIPVESLSSGEKQLLIFLSETLLQEGMPHIFLADEPELSLHVEWQEELVPSLLKLNPNAQVLFATHSPDIVGRFQENVIEMEGLI